MENPSAKYYKAISEYYNIPNSEYTFKNYYTYTLFEINNELFVVMTEEQIDYIRNNYIENVIESIHLPFRYQHLENYLDKNTYAIDCWLDSSEYDFIEGLVKDEGFRFVYINTLHEIPF